MRRALRPWIWLRRLWRDFTRAAPLWRRGERLAARHLRRQGCRVVACGARSQTGELDIVAVENRTIVFVEVKTRSSLAAGHPAEAVDLSKQRRLARQALGYLKRHGLLEYPARFDVIAITWPDGARPSLEHIRNAFEPPERWQLYA